MMTVRVAKITRGGVNRKEAFARGQRKLRVKFARGVRMRTKRVTKFIR